MAMHDLLHGWILMPRGLRALSSAQAQSQVEMALWMQVIQNATASSLGCAVRSPRMSQVAGSTVFGQIRSTNGNQRCADCGARNPSWASINLGAVFCLACAGVHRQMGVHISKVRSLELDIKEWSEPLLALMRAIGNTAVNEIWHPAAVAEGEEACVAPDATPAQREAHIRKKYDARTFLREELRPAAEDVHVAAMANDTALMAKCLAYGLSIDAPAPTTSIGEWSEVAAARHGGRSAIHIAAAEASETVLELLLQNLFASTVDIDAGDQLGKSALKLAVESGAARCVTQLITRGANISYADSAHQTPMQAAAELGHEAICEAMLAYKLAQDEKRLAEMQLDVDE
jgi:Arf-GAP/GTPase/ANK repeat/PH domain-containing protein 2